jgi:hypothetical protein
MLKKDVMKSTYLIKIFIKELQTKFYIETDSSMITMAQVHKEIIDYLGKNVIEWEPNPLKFSGTANGSGFYITYEEVENGKRQNVTLRKEDTTRV